MSYRAMALVGASVLFATQCYAESAINNSKSNTFKQTTQTGGRAHPEGSPTIATGRTTTYNNSKSNNFRMGGGGGGKGASGNAVKLNSSRSN